MMCLSPLFTIMDIQSNCMCRKGVFFYLWHEKIKSVKPEAALLPSGKTAAGRVSMCPVTIRKPESLVVIPFTAKHRKKSQRKLRAATSSIDNGTFQEPRKITVAEYAAEYMTTHVATLTDSTQRSYEKNLRLHILPALVLAV